MSSVGMLGVVGITKQLGMLGIARHCSVSLGMLYLALLVAL
jgi:hypothetical protein